MTPDQMLVRAEALTALNAAGCVAPLLFAPHVEARLHVDATGRVVASDSSGASAAEIVRYVREEFDPQPGKFFRK